MSEYWIAAILGVVEGVTEFLPISSTGHLIIVGRFLEFKKPFADVFEVVIQLGAILSVVVYFRKTLFPPLSADTKEKRERRREIFDIWMKSALGVLPAILIGGLWGKKISEHLFNPGVVAGALFVGGILLVVIDRKKRAHKFDSVKELPWLIALLTGVAQCLAMIPGTSRSAATIIGAMLLGASRKTAAEFSFFLAIPTMCAASAYSIMKHGASMTHAQWSVLAVGFVVSFFVAWGVIAFFMEYIRTRTFCLFGYYRIVLAVAVVLYFFVLHRG